MSPMAVDEDAEQEFKPQKKKISPEEEKRPVSFFLFSYFVARYSSLIDYKGLVFLANSVQYIAVIELVFLVN